MAELSRRLFIGGSLLGVAGTGVVARGAEPEEGGGGGTPEGAAPPEPPSGHPRAMGAVPIALVLDGADEEATVGADETALHWLRRGCGITGVKESCGAGTCGACTVTVDGVPQVTCLLPAMALHGTRVGTVRALGGPDPATMHPVQRAFLAHDALQCGFCTPGFVVEAAAFHDRWRSNHGTAEPSRDDVAAALAGHLCRCGAYENIHAAVIAACKGEHDDPAALSFDRVDGPDKVSGTAEYTVDVQLPGMLVGLAYRSPHAHARLQGLDERAARQVRGVRAVLRRIPDGGEVRYPGQEVAAVAADDEAAARAGLAALAPKWEVLTAVTTMEASQAPGAPAVYPRRADVRPEAPAASEGPVLPAGLDGNLRGPTSTSILAKPRAGRKAVEEAAVSGVVAAGTWRMGVQLHTTLEPHAAVARWSGEAVEVWASTQSVGWLAEDVAQRWKLPREAVTVHGRFVGGAFGAKAGLQHEIALAIELAREAGAPVRVALSRPEELLVGGFRPGQQVELALGVADGQLAGLTQRAYGESGVAVGNLIGYLARIVYDTPRKDLDDYDVLTNGPPGKPMRGPGGPASFFALETAVDMAAQQLGEDPVAVRRRWDPNVVRQHLYDWVEALPAYKDRGPVGADTGRFRRGTGLAIGGWFEFYDPNTQVELEAGPEGFLARCNTQDVGTGVASVLAHTVAASLGVPVGAVRVEVGSNAGDVHGPAAAGSRSTASVVPAAQDAAERLLRELEDLGRDRGIDGSAVPGGLQPEGGGAVVPWAEVLAGASTVRVRGRRKRDHKAAVVPFAFIDTKIGRVFPGVVNVTTVEVDTRLGRVSVVEGWCGLGVGRIVCPALAENQLKGAFVQNVGLSLYEERRLDPATGRLLSHNLDDYRVPGIGDSAPYHVHFEERGFEHVRGGSVGLGEIGGVAVAGSIGNAFHHATGKRAFHMPLTPKTVLEVLR
ncbi:MAG: molybdopterin cofactor-binding domain-containing protein [Myxococcota bacterium]